MSYIFSRALHAGADLHDRGVAAVLRIGVLACFAVLFGAGALLFLFTSIWIELGVILGGAFVVLSTCEATVNKLTAVSPLAFRLPDEAAGRKSVALGAVSFAPIFGGLAVSLARPYFEGVGQ